MAGDIAKALARYSIPVPIGRQKFHICCPIHAEKTPSCHVDLNKQEWHCFGCDAGGDAVELVKLADKVTYPEALRILGLDDAHQGAGNYSARHIQTPTRRVASATIDQVDTEEDLQAIAAALKIYDSCTPLLGSLASWYCEARGVSAVIAAVAGTRYCVDFMQGGPAVVFPVFDDHDQLTAVQGRFLFPAPENYHGKRPDKQTRGRLRGVFLTAGAFQQSAVIITEAPIDALSLSVCGFPALALLGTHYPAWLPARIGTRRVYAATDNDGAGEGAAQKLCDDLSAKGGRIYRLKPEGVKDWNEYLCRFGPLVMESAIIAAAFPSRVPTVSSAFVDWYERIARAKCQLESLGPSAG